MKRKNKDALIIGLALFAMFFGAGNLIFPPQIGLFTGERWYIAAIGFLITGIGLPLLGIFAAVKGGEALKRFYSKIGKKTLIVFQIFAALALGFVAIPRTGATTHEMGFSLIFTGVSPYFTALIFFGVTIILAIKPTGIIDRIGKFLTPVLVLMLGIIIVKGIMDPVDLAAASQRQNEFSEGFMGGYQTMDALGALIFGGIILNAFREKGYTTQSEQIKMTAKAGIIALFGLALVYGGLMYLGSTVSGVVPLDTGKTTLTIMISSLLLGNTGAYLLGIGVSFACLTTSVGLVATIADFFSDITHKKMPYKANVVVLTIASGFISIIGVDAIVEVAGPMLTVLYPMAIMLMIFIMCDRFIYKTYVYKMTLSVTFFIAVLQGMEVAGLLWNIPSTVIDAIPLGSEGFPWVVPTATMLLITLSHAYIARVRETKVLKVNHLHGK